MLGSKQAQMRWRTRLDQGSDAYLFRSITRKRLDISVPARSDASEFCAESEVLEGIQRLVEVDLDEEA